jgi:hypothetical protein
MRGGKVIMVIFFFGSWQLISSEKGVREKRVSQILLATSLRIQATASQSKEIRSIIN